jgi:hypothetical protein
VPTLAFNVVLWNGIVLVVLVLGRLAYIASRLSWTKSERQTPLHGALLGSSGAITLTLPFLFLGLARIPASTSAIWTAFSILQTFNCLMMQPLVLVLFTVTLRGFPAKGINEIITRVVQSSKCVSHSSLTLLCVVLAIFALSPSTSLHLCLNDPSQSQVVLSLPAGFLGAHALAICNSAARAGRDRRFPTSTISPCRLCCHCDVHPRPWVGIYRPS